MSWEEPEFEPVNMSAEIGAYYDDFAEQPVIGTTPTPSDSPAATGAEPGRGQDQ